MARVGRPRKITPHIARKIFLLAGYGLTTAQLAEVFDFSVDAIKNLQQDAQFDATLKRCKEKADLEVINSLYKRAVGYEAEDVEFVRTTDPAGNVLDSKIEKVKRRHVPGDTTACIFWLKNRQRKDWRDKVEDAPTGGDTHYHLTFVSPAQDPTEKIEENRISELVL